jgi:hypothetical protein
MIPPTLMKLFPVPSRPLFHTISAAPEPPAIETLIRSGGSYADETGGLSGKAIAGIVLTGAAVTALYLMAPKQLKDDEESTKGSGRGNPSRSLWVEGTPRGEYNETPDMTSNYAENSLLPLGIGIMGIALSSSSSSSYLQYTNDFELVIRATKDLEHLLETRFDVPMGKHVCLQDKVSQSIDFNIMCQNILTGGVSVWSTHSLSFDI